MQSFFASGTFFYQGVLLDRYCVHTERSNSMITFNWLLLAANFQPFFTHTRRLSSVTILLSALLL